MTILIKILSKTIDIEESEVDDKEFIDHITDKLEDITNISKAH